MVTPSGHCSRGAEAVGGVVVVRHGYNPLTAIQNVKAKIDEIAPSLPVKAVVDYNRTGRAALEAFARDHDFEAYVGAEIKQEAWTRWLASVPREQWPEGVTTSR